MTPPKKSDPLKTDDGQFILETDNLDMAAYCLLRGARVARYYLTQDREKAFYILEADEPYWKDYPSSDCHKFIAARRSLVSMVKDLVRTQRRHGKKL